MKGSRSNSTLVRALEKPCEGKGEVANSDFLPALGVGDPRECRVYVAIPPSLDPLEGRGEVANADFLPAFGVGEPRKCRGYVAVLPSFGPPRRPG